MGSPAKILVLKAGTAAAALRSQAGDYDAWFSDALAGSPVQWTVCKAWLGERIPDAGDFDGVLMTGSPLSVTQLEPWMGAAADALVRAAEQGNPVLGVCFGHQLLAHALGGRVEVNPKGREIGTIEVRPTSEARGDALMSGLRVPLTFQATHEDCVTALPAKAVLLAENDKGVQAFSVGPRVWGVQFHPELDARRMRTLIETRREKLVAEGIYEPSSRGVRETASGRDLLRAWLQVCLA